jgi:hypothetical protein
MQVGADDFVSGDPIELTNYFDQNVDIHHIFPKAYCIRENYRQQVWNSIVNKSPLTARTNRVLGGNKPSIYIRSIERNFSLDSEGLDEHLRSHLIDSDLLRSDDFDNFIRDRATKLLDLIEKSIGKSVTGRDSDEVIAAFGGKLISSGSLMEAYCMRCKAIGEMTDATAITMKNGQPATKGICPKCGTEMFRIGKA